MKPDVKIRELIHEDMQHVVNMLQHVSLFKPGNIMLDELAKNFESNKKSYACVAEINTKVVGFGSVFILDRIRGGRSAIIEDVVVDQHYRGIRVGHAIVNQLITYARVSSCFKITLIADDHNIGFYESLGFAMDKQNMKLFLKPGN